MKGLLLKEFYNQRLIFIIYLAIVVLVSLIAISDVDVASSSETIPTIEEINRTSIFTLLPLGFLAGFYPGNLVISSYSFDEKAHWTPFIISVGVKKSTILWSKIILNLITSIILFIPFLIGMLGVNAYFDANIYIGLILTFFGTALFSGSVAIFICSALGSSKAIAIVSFISIFISLIPLSLIIIPATIPGMMNLIWVFGLACFLVFGLIFYIIFYFSSLALFKKRDF